MSWFKRIKEGITTSTKEKKETPEGLWHKCSHCKNIVPSKDHASRMFVCEKCGHHDRINSQQYFEILFDDEDPIELNPMLSSDDPLDFVDTKKYTERIKENQKKTGMSDAIRTVAGKVQGENVVIACMDFSFIGGSMGSVVGEKISRAIDYCIENQTPLMIIS